jgi:hypothetical protein
MEWVLDSNIKGYLGGGSYGAYGQYDANNSGTLGGSNFGVYGRSNSLYGVWGYNSATSGTTYGVYGQSIVLLVEVFMVTIVPLLV